MWKKPNKVDLFKVIIEKTQISPIRINVEKSVSQFSRLCCSYQSVRLKQRSDLCLSGEMLIFYPYYIKETRFISMLTRVKIRVFLRSKYWEIHVRGLCDKEKRNHAKKHQLQDHQGNSKKLWQALTQMGIPPNGKAKVFNISLRN